MPEDPAPRDLVELARRSIEIEDLDGAIGFYAPDGVWDASPWGMGTFSGDVEVRAFFEEWRRSYAEMEWTAEEICDHGHGVTFAVILHKGRLLGSSRSVQLRYAAVTQWRDGLIARNTTYTDIEQARAAARRLAAERA
jgi:ketosteroid isomerase-like protein